MRDHVNACWDEALDSSAYAPDLRRAWRQRLLTTLCADYARAPASYQLDPEQDATLAYRCRSLGLRADAALRLGSVCGDGAVSDEE